MKFLNVLALLFISSISFAQPLVFFESTDIVISENADVFVDGTVFLNTNAIVSIEGSLKSNGDFISQGILDVSGSIQVKGDLSLLGASSIFSQNSQVHLNGGSQTVFADAAPSLGELYCIGQQTKTLETNLGVQLLFLDSSLIYTQNHTLNVLSEAQSAISYTTGWIKSDSSGSLSRNMLEGNTYEFPVGDDLQRLMVRITPSADVNSGVRYADVDANEEGLYRFQVDPSICSLNDSAYIQLYNVNASESIVELRFPGNFSESFPVLCEREPLEFEQWNILSEDQPVLNDNLAVYEIIPTKDNAAIILGRTRPLSPQIEGVLEACQGTEGLSYEALGASGNDLVWNVGGGTIVSEQDSTIQVNWLYNQSGILSVVASDDFGCTSLPAEAGIVLFQLPVANMIITEPALPFELEVYTIESQSSGASALQWEISNGQSYSTSPFDIRFEAPGLYEVLLTVTSNEGCVDTASQTIEIVEGFIFSNVFTPNGDGINDELKFPNSGLSEFSLSIFSRWGNEVFNSEFSKESWDGRDFSGNLVPAGTYFYILQAKSGSKDYSKQGSLQVYY